MSDVPEPTYINQHVALARPGSGVLPRYLAWYLTSEAVQRQWARQQRGVTKLGLGLDDIRSVRTPLPPLAEQVRIVAAIEKQLSRIDAGAAALDRVRRNIKRTHAAVLQAALREALTCADGVSSPIAELLSQPLANGKSVPDGPPDGFPVLRLTAVREGKIDVTCAKAGAWTASDAAPYIIAKGDYLVVRGNGSKRLVGRGGLVTVDSNIAYPDTLIRIRFDHKLVLPEYAAVIWDSGTVRRQIEMKARTTAGIYKINQRDLEEITVPVPAIADQQRLLSKVESHLICALSESIATSAVSTICRPAADSSTVRSSARPSTVSRPVIGGTP